MLHLERLYQKALLIVFERVFPCAPLSCRLLEWITDRGIDIKSFESFEISKPLIVSTRRHSDLRYRLYSMLTNVRALSVSHCVSEDMLLLSELIRYCNILEGLKIKHCTGAAEVCIVLVKISPPLLTLLDFTGCVDLSEYAVALLFRRCPHIKTLNVTGCYDMSSVVIQAVVVWGTHLISLHISGCFQITCRYMLLLALHGRRSLKELCSDQCTDRVAAVMCVGMLGSALHSLDLTNCHFRFTDRGVQCIKTSCKYMTNLNLSHCRQLTNDCVCQLVQSLPLLTTLNLSFIIDVSDSTLVQIGLGCPHLTELNIGHCYAVTDLGILAVANRINGIRSTSLHCVYRITDRALNVLLARYPRLTQLHICWNLHLTNYCMSAIGAKCNQLTSLSLATLGLSNFTVLAILLALHCGLVYLDIGSNIYITDTALLSLANSRSGLSLTSLNASYCEQISNRSLCAMARRCIRLVSLDIQGCTSVVDGDGILEIVTKCKRIKKIRATGITLSVAGYKALNIISGSIVELM